MTGVYKRSYRGLSALIATDHGRINIRFWGQFPFEPSRKSRSIYQMLLALLACELDNSFR